MGEGEKGKEGGKGGVGFFFSFLLNCIKIMH